MNGDSVESYSDPLGVSESNIDAGPLSDTELAIVVATVAASGMAIMAALSKRDDDEDDEM